MGKVDNKEEELNLLIVFITLVVNPGLFVYRKQHVILSPVQSTDSL